MSESARKAFFDSGQKDLDLTLAAARRCLNPGFQPSRGLDFGCGVGRVLIPMARQLSRVTGVDVSQAMLEEAKRNCEIQNVKNVEFVQSDDSLSTISQCYDFIHALIVLQHISVPRGEKIVNRLLELMADNGIAMLHLTYAWKASRITKLAHAVQKTIPPVQKIINFCQGRPINYPFMEMNQYDLNRIFQLFHEHGIKRMLVEPTAHGEHIGVKIYLQKSVA